ncbi:MAG: glycosyltransferase family 2 protein [Patescibacteria group bacterium]
MDLSIIIVNRNTCELLKKCLASIYNNTANLDFEIIVIDNASTDDSIQMTKNRFSQVKIITNNINTGYAFANNQGIKISTGDFILLLNSDTEVLPNCLPTMISYMRVHPQAGLAGCKLLNIDQTLQPSVRRNPRLWDQMVILTKLPNFFPNAIKHYLYSDFDYNHEAEVDQIMGAFMLIRRAVVNQIGGLDQNTFFWFDDVDYCQRTKNAGWQIIYTPIAQIIHLKGYTADKYLPLTKQKMFVKSLLYYFKKQQGIGAYLILLPGAGLSLVLAWLVQLFKIKKKNKDL